MIKEDYQIVDENTEPPIVITVRRDRRLKKNARWSCENPQQILLRVPFHTTKHQVKKIADDLSVKLRQKKDKAERLTDADLQERAEYINRRHFNSEIEWEAIRWVTNMEKRLGSCTSGGITDGHIRISHHLKDWPQWVIDYVIAHELAHRIHPNHSAKYWEYLKTAYPKAEKARGFIEGVTFAQGLSLEDDLED